MLVAEQRIRQRTVKRMRTTLAIVTAAGLLASCAAPKPVLYPNAQLERAGKARAEQDIAGCQALARDAGARQADGKAGQAARSGAAGAIVGGGTGAVVGLITGHPGRSAAIGAAGGGTGGFLSSLVGRPQPSTAYRSYVDRCLRECGYD